MRRSAARDTLQSTDMRYELHRGSLETGMYMKVNLIHDQHGAGLQFGHTSFMARSRIRPGGRNHDMHDLQCRRMMSSRRLVPPVVTMTSTPRCLPSSLQTWLVCRASSRVGTKDHPYSIFTPRLIVGKSLGAQHLVSALGDGMTHA